MSELADALIARVQALESRLAHLEALEYVAQADLLDGLHASAVAAANTLLALDAASKLPASITGDADTVDGLHAADIAAGGVIVGAIVMWSGTLGGSDGHRPVVGGVANEDWHLCNGDVVGSVTTPDLRDKFVVGAGSSYVKGATGGATTASHNHAAIGSLAAGTVGSSHSHRLVLESGKTLAAGSNLQQYWSNTATDGAHGHNVTGKTALSAPSILPPYYGLYYVMKVA